MRARLLTLTGLAFLLVACGPEAAWGPPVMDPDAGMDGAIPPLTMPGTLVLRQSATGFVDSFAASHDAYDLAISEAGRYAVAITDAGADLWVRFYEDAGHAQLLGECGGSSEPSACFFDLPVGTLYLDVAYEGSAGEAYAFSVVPVASEGSAASPIPLVLGEPRVVALPVAGVGYYQLTAVAVSGYSTWIAMLATLGASPLDHPTVEVYADADFGGVPVASCADDPCAIPGLDPGVTIGLKVLEDDGAERAFLAEGYDDISEGSWASPVDLTLADAHDGGVSDRSRSYYRFTTNDHAGGYEVILSYSLGGHAVRAYESPGDPAPFYDCAGVTPCTLNGLEANTTYYVTVGGGPWGTDAYEITVSAGLSEGTIANPFALQEGISHSATLDRNGIGYYSFTAPTSGSYLFTLTADPPGVGTRPTRYRFPDGTFTDGSLYCDFQNTCYLLDVAAGTTLHFTINNDEPWDVSFIALIERDPLSEGASTDPYPLTVGVDHDFSINPGRPNYYSFTTDADGGLYGLSLWTTEFTYVDIDGGAVADCYPNNAAHRHCTFAGLAPNTTYMVTVWGSVYGPTGSGSLHVHDLDPSVGCETGPGAGICFDFESGTTPAGFTEPASWSDGPWSVSMSAAATGSYGFLAASGKNVYTSCFEYTVAAEGSRLVFSANLASDNPDDDLWVSVNDSESYHFRAGDWSGWNRHLITVYPAAGNVWRLCWYQDISGSTASFAIDDMQFD